MKYSDLLQPSSGVSECAEEKNEYYFISERHVQVIWFEQKYFKFLKTTKDDLVEVISPGIWNSESGPDFLKAHIKINGQEYRGDVEIHLHDEGWVQHNHHRDERYNSVILHLSLWESSTATELLRKDGHSIPNIYLEPLLTVSTQRLLNLIDLDLYPYKKFLGSGKCSQSLFKRLSREKIEDFFVSASYWRLHQKKEYLSAHFKTEPLQFAAGMATALGYKNNAEAFLELFTYLLGYEKEPQEDLLAIALGCSGFFDTHRKKYWLDSDYYSLLKGIWNEKFKQIDYRVALRLDHIRPLNHPVRRLAYLVKWITRLEKDHIFENLLQIWEHRKKVCCNLVQLRNTLIEALPDYLDEYWMHHYTFETAPREERLSLIGKDLRETILINSFFPLLAARIYESGNEQERREFQELYGSFGAKLPGKSYYLIHRFFGDTPKGELLHKAQMEQGAFQLHKDFCVHFEASCDGCPFVERYLNVFE